ncbi:hypothetical protein AMAG_08752 [Allomyces macrogynus ATCC 38327]|uniref:Uncharacterized protein n=1 Tax=Allomyces macrogynus (strain ATCC 38327) TaxID=578462 RepID=A0A0L0SMP1_ALLM3|nr:hypothetical protein AMAG_08752 [Allomyces macrogynus ATCC 38327]|eukprot:KNE63650.1 hypothetical protein AMAG_08752 [Allomyces macrogynus ATCC 38327]
MTLPFPALKDIEYYAESHSKQPGWFLASIAAPNLTCLTIHFLDESWTRAEVGVIARQLPKFPALHKLYLLGGVSEVGERPAANRAARRLVQPLLRGIPTSVVMLTVNFRFEKDVNDSDKVCIVAARTAPAPRPARAAPTRPAPPPPAPSHRALALAEGAATTVEQAGGLLGSLQKATAPLRRRACSLPGPRR